MSVAIEPWYMGYVKNGIETAIETFHDAAVVAGWWLDPVTGSDLRGNPYVVASKMALIHSEVSEAVEAFRRDKMDDHLTHRSGVECELADCLIRIFDLAGMLGLDLAGAVLEKHQYNLQRADHKMENRQKTGGKKF